MNSPVKPETRWEERPFVRPGDIAERFGVSLSTVYNAIKSGDLDGRKIGPKIWIVRREDADKWAQASTHGA